MTDLIHQPTLTVVAYCRKHDIVEANSNHGMIGTIDIKPLRKVGRALGRVYLEEAVVAMAMQCRSYISADFDTMLEEIYNRKIE